MLPAVAVLRSRLPYPTRDKTHGGHSPIIRQVRRWLFALLWHPLHPMDVGAVVLVALRKPIALLVWLPHVCEEAGGQMSKLAGCSYPASSKSFLVSGQVASSLSLQLGWLISLRLRRCASLSGLRHYLGILGYSLASACRMHHCDWPL